MNPNIASDIHCFWFDEVGKDNWFGGGDDLDTTTRARFAEHWQALRAQAAPAFLGDDKSALAGCLLFDQFPRNMFRGTADAFATDPLSLAIAQGAVKDGLLSKLSDDEKQFVLMPFMHSEELAVQDRCVELFATHGLDYNLEFARDHREAIVRFGRFPSRNAALGRDTTEAEKAWLDAGGGWG
ncbi:MAG: DUF924 family protein [Pseudomonadota bacterium]